MTIIFRRAILNDVYSLQTINEELQVGTSEEGFLSQILNFENLLLTEEHSIYVAEEAGELLGYIIVAPSFPEDRLSYLRNSIYPLLDLTNSAKYHYIKQLAVQRKYQRQGIGSFLYTSLFALFPLHLFLGIVLAENQASLNFQLTKGAQVAAEYWKKEKLAGYLLVKGQSLLPVVDIIEENMAI